VQWWELSDGVAVVAAGGGAMWCGDGEEGGA
jgi:hypothetical protein